MKDHFDKTYWYICGTSLIVLIYVISITFFVIPKENQRFVDIALAFLLGFISANASYLTGGNPNSPKKPTEGSPQTLDMTLTASSKPTEPNTDDKG